MMASIRAGLSLQGWAGAKAPHGFLAHTCHMTIQGGGGVGRYKKVEIV